MTAKALDLLIEGEQKLLAVYDARQASADTRTTALATAAVALPTLILSLSEAFSDNEPLLWVTYGAVIMAAAVVVACRAWAAWRRRSDPDSGNEHRVSAEGAAVIRARKAWRTYQEQTPVEQADPVRVRQLALDMWRTRAQDSHKVAQVKDILSVVAALAFLSALALSAILVAHADFTTW